MTPSEFRAQGIIVPILTPFNDANEMDLKALEHHLEWLIKHNIGGVMPCGTTGEGPLLSYAERVQLTETTAKIVKHRLPVMAHVGSITTEETVKLALAAQKSGVEAISVVTPYYYHMDERALIKHYTSIAKSVEALPVFLYTIPHCTTNDISKQTIEKICDLAGNVVGIKDSSGDFEKMIGYKTLCRGTFQVICGSDGLLLEALRQGAVAGVSGNANVFPNLVVSLFEALKAGDPQIATSLQKTLDSIRALLQDGGNLSLMKKVLAHQGLPECNVRPPLLEAQPQLVKDVIKQLNQLDLI